MTDREKVIHGLELVKEDICERFTSGSQITVDCLRIDKTIAMLKEQPEIVRCRDCIYNDDGDCIIKAGWFPVKPDWFCADGKRKD